MLLVMLREFTPCFRRYAYFRILKSRQCLDCGFRRALESEFAVYKVKLFDWNCDVMLRHAKELVSRDDGERNRAIWCDYDVMNDANLLLLFVVDGLVNNGFFHAPSF